MLRRCSRLSLFDGERRCTLATHNNYPGSCNADSLPPLAPLSLRNQPLLSLLHW